MRAARPVDRTMQPRSGEQDPEEAEDRARRAHRRDVATEDEAPDRPRRGTREIEDKEPDRAVPALDDRPGEVQGVHVEEQVEHAPVQQRDRPEAPVLPRSHGPLVELEGVEDRLAFVESRADAETMTVAAMRIVVTGDERPVARDPWRSSVEPRWDRRSPWSASPDAWRSPPCPPAVRACRPGGRPRSHRSGHRRGPGRPRGCATRHTSTASRRAPRPPPRSRSAAPSSSSR